MQKQHLPVVATAGPMSGAQAGGSPHRPAKRRRHELAQPDVIDLTRDEDEPVARAARPPATFTCAVCLSDVVPRAHGHRLFCGHTYCRDCLAGLVSSAVGAGLPEAEGMRCPELSCRRPLTGADVDACAPDAATARRFHALALDRLVARSKDDGMGCCPTPGCAFVFVWDDANRKLVCPLCRKQYCLKCKCNWHSGVRCEAHTAASADDGGMAALAKSGKWKACPHCGAWVQRVDGCNAMQCRCSKKFCYSCGHKTGGGAAGKGDCTCKDAFTVHAHKVHKD